VALRLGKIIEQRLPGADVVYTPFDDTFVSLEERRTSRPGQADLLFRFIEFKQDTRARHRTYYPEPEGLGGSDGGGRRGEKKSRHGAGRRTRAAGSGDENRETEKIDESKNFAEDIQDSLAKRIQKSSKPVKNRGVRKAPFWC